MVARFALGLLFAVLLVGSILPAQNQYVTITPARPAVGNQITLTYDDGSKGAPLRDAGSMTAEVLIARSDDAPQLVELPMKKSGAIWKTSYKLADKGALILLYRFVAGEQQDDNGASSWNTLIYDMNGSPIEGAHLLRGTMFRSGGYYGFKLSKDVAAAGEDLALERKLYPDNLAPLFLQWQMLMREKPGDETKARIKSELETVYGKGQMKEENLAQAAIWFDQLGMKEKAEEIRKSAVAENPKGKVAESVRLTEVSKERDFGKRADLIEKFLVDFPQKGFQKANYESMLAAYRLNAYLQAKKYDEAAAMLDAMPVKDGNSYNSLAWPLIEKGEQLEKAVAWAGKGVDLLKNPDSANRPSFMSTSQWEKNNKQMLGMVLDTYAYGLVKMGKSAEAENAYAEAVKLSDGSSEDVNQRYVECLVKNEKYDKAVVTSEGFIRQGKSNEKMMDAYRTAYIKLKGSDQGFDAALSDVQAAAKGAMKSEILKNRVNKPAVDFALKGLDGKIVKLSDLRGKVVVVDFWATWCGPCKASFPYLQQVYNKYKENPNVVILALDTWENVSGKEREELVKKFMADNKYTFPVLYDEGFVEKYGVEGIPTKFIIDKKGMIQFKTVGFTGAKMVDEMILQLDALLDDRFYSSLN